MRRKRASRGRATLGVTAALVLVLTTAPASLAGHKHDYAPCWGNGYGDGDNNNGYMHPYIHYQGDASCGYHALASNLRIAQHVHSGPRGGGTWSRVYYNHCGFGYDCHADLGTAVNECEFASALVAETAFADHWHYHHYTCAFTGT